MEISVERIHKMSCMQNHQQQLAICASPGKVYEALTTPEGIAGWWTTDSHLSRGQLLVRFGNTFKQFDVTHLTPWKHVEWVCVDAYLDVPGIITKPKEWIGTTIVFDLTSDGRKGAHLRMEHQGLTPSVQCHDLCVQGWLQFLGSLKAYCETGKGSPYFTAVG